MLRVTLLHGAKWLRSVNHSEVGRRRQNEIILLYQLCHTNGPADMSMHSVNVVYVASSV